MTTIRPVLTEHVASVLPQALPFIEQGMAHATAYNVEHVKVYLADGTWSLFVAVKDDFVTGAYVVCYQNEPSHRVAFIVSAAGAGLGSKDLLGQLDDQFRAYGVTKVKALARASAARLYTRSGFKETSILVEKDLWAI